MNRPREWILSWKPFQNNNIWFVEGEGSMESEETVEVIEKSALAELEAKLAKAEVDLSKAIERLKELKRPGAWGFLTLIDQQRIDKTLAEIEGDK